VRLIRAAAFVAVLVHADSVRAHEQHPVEALLRIEADRYSLSMPFDVPALLLSRTLNHTDAGEAARELLALSAEERERAFAQAERYFRIHLRVEIDGRRGEHAIELPSFEPGPLGQLGRVDSKFYVRLSGSIPRGAKALTLTPGRALREWVVVPSVAGVRLPPLQLTGGITGPPVSLEPPPSRREVFLQQLGPAFRSTFRLALPLSVLLGSLLLLTIRARAVGAQIAAFAPGAALTLGLAALGDLEVPVSVATGAVALAVVVLAGEDLLTDRLRVWRPTVVFAAGLFFGLLLGRQLEAHTGFLLRPGAAFAGWLAGFLFALSLLVPPAWALLLAAERRGALRRGRRPLLIALILMGLCWAGVSLGPSTG
jgi:hypothetical protein